MTDKPRRRRRVRQIFGALALCVGVTLAADAQSRSVTDTADRPGFADSPVLLGRGDLQLESGLMWEREGKHDALTKTLTWPQLELHAGVMPRLEVSVTWDGLVSTASSGP